MRRVTYSMSTSLDGYIAGLDGAFDWSVPDADVFQLALSEIDGVSTHLLGRRLYETMVYWETAKQEVTLHAAELEWAGLWQELPKVFSRTLTEVRGSHTRLATGTVAEEIARLRVEPTEGDIAIGGATLAAEAAALDLIDEYLIRVYPVLDEGRTPFFAQQGRRVNLNLIENAPSARSSTSATRATAEPRRTPGDPVSGTSLHSDGRFVTRAWVNRPPTGPKLVP